VQYAAQLAECGLVGEALNYSAAAAALAGKARADRRAQHLLFAADHALAAAQDAHARLQAHAAAVGAPPAATSGVSLMKRVGSFLDNKVQQFIGTDGAPQSGPRSGNSTSSNKVRPGAQGGATLSFSLFLRLCLSLSLSLSLSLHLSESLTACQILMVCRRNEFRSVVHTPFWQLHGSHA
jgi:hypothetical protein